MKTTKQNTDVCFAKLHVHTEALLFKKYWKSLVSYDPHCDQLIAFVRTHSNLVFLWYKGRNFQLSLATAG